MHSLFCNLYHRFSPVIPVRADNAKDNHYITAEENIILIFIGNVIGCCIMFMFPAAAGPLVAAKLAQPAVAILFKAILCGILIYIAVEGFKKGNQLITLLAVPTFILCGAEHSIADVCFIIAANMITLEAIGFVCLVALGNAIGSIIIHRLIDLSEKI